MGTQDRDFVETKRRSFAKALSYRVIGTAITALIVWVGTGKWGMALTVGVLDSFVKIFVYFLHERLWLKIPFGKLKKPDYEI